MSGHSKWHSIKHKKGAADAKRGKIFTRHANLITIAAREGGGALEMNPALRLAVESAKKDNVPNANIDRAIKRGTGELKDAAEILSLSYEGYGPCGVAIIVDCLTDNKNRAYTNVRTIFGKRGGNLGTSGSVAWMFDRKGVIQVNVEGKNLDDLELSVIDAGAQDLENEGSHVTLYTAATELNEVKEKLRSMGIEVEKAELMMIPNTTVKLENEEDVRRVVDFVDALEEDEDVSNVWVNYEASDDLMERVMG